MWEKKAGILKQIKKRGLTRRKPKTEKSEATCSMKSF